MFDLGEWDLLTLTDVRMVNAAMVARQNELITRFNHHSESFRIKGRFGPWRIVPSQSTQILQVELPVTEGELRVPGYRVPTRLGGITLRVRLALRLLPVGSREEVHDLVFDFDELEDDEGAVRAISYDDPEGQLEGIEAVIFKLAVARCLSANAAEVSFVFGSVKCRGSLQDESLRLPYQGWANVETTGGRHYLALGAAFNAPKAPLQNIDPEILVRRASAYVAMSRTFLMTRVIYPSLDQGFSPPIPFRHAGTKASNMVPIDLGSHRHGSWIVRPIVRRLVIEQGQKALTARAETTTALPMDARLESLVELSMPFHFDAGTRSLSFLPDPNPRDRHRVIGSGPFSGLVAFLVTLILGLNVDALKALVKVCAGQLQGTNLKTVTLAEWNSVRDFRIDTADLNGALVLSDTRDAVGPGSAAAPVG